MALPVMKVSPDNGQTWIPVLPGIPGPKGDPGVGFIVLDPNEQIPPDTPDGTIVLVRSS